MFPPVHAATLEPKWKTLTSPFKKEGTMNNTTIIGLDIAKNSFHACVMAGSGKVLERKRLYRSEVIGFFLQYPRSLVAMESCGGSSYWARELEKLGHEVRIISAQFVKLL